MDTLHFHCPELSRDKPLIFKIDFKILSVVLHYLVTQTLSAHGQKKRHPVMYIDSYAASSFFSQTLTLASNNNVFFLFFLPSYWTII